MVWKEGCEKKEKELRKNECKEKEKRFELGPAPKYILQLAGSASDSEWFNNLRK
jgi:hypothetical protein